MNAIPPNALTSTPEHTRIESVDCAICLENDSNSIALITSTTICNHTFHKACLDNWLKVSNSCPQCRAVISDRVVEPIEPFTHHVWSYGEFNIALVQTIQRTHADGERLSEQSQTPQPRENALTRRIKNPLRVRHRAARMRSRLVRCREDVLAAMALRSPSYKRLASLPPHVRQNIRDLHQAQRLIVAARARAAKDSDENSPKIPQQQLNPTAVKANSLAAPAAVAGCLASGNPPVEQR